MTIYLSNRDGNGKTSEEGHYRFQTALYSGNVIEATSMQVTQNSPLAMSVLVQPGNFKIDTTGYSYTGWSNAATALVISTADGSNPRITTVVAYVDKSAPTSASPVNNPGIIKLMSVDGSPSATPVAPTDSSIQTAVGAGNPYLKLANVQVDAGATTIANAKITDLRSRVRVTDDVIKASNISQVSNPAAYPIGSLYFNASDSTNPATLLGFGTWTSFGAGRVLVGLDGSDSDFNPVGKTGGEKTHILTIPEMPSHTHGVNDPGHAHGMPNFYNSAGGAGRAALAGGSSLYWGAPATNGSGTGIWLSNQGGDGAHNNMQPYIVVYIWKRTA